MAYYTLACTGWAAVAVKTASTSAAVRANRWAAAPRSICRVCLSTQGVEQQLLTMLQKKLRSCWDSITACSVRHAMLKLRWEIACSVKCLIGRETIFSDSTKYELWFQFIWGTETKFQHKTFSYKKNCPRNQGNTIQMILLIQEIKSMTQWTSWKTPETSFTSNIAQLQSGTRSISK